MKKVGHPSEFLLGIYWWTWKTNNYQKDCWSGPIKNKITLIFLVLHFLKKIRKNTCRYHYENLDDMIYSSWYIEQNIMKLVILCHSLLFYPPKIPKNQNFKKWKNLLEISSFYTCVTKITIIWCTVPEIWGKTDKKICHFGPYFALLPPPLLMISKIKILKKYKKRMPGDIIFLHIHVYHKWRSYDIWFLKHKVQQTEMFVTLGHSLPFQPADNPQNQNFKIEESTWRYYHLTNLHHKWQYDIWFPGYGVWQTEFFLIVNCFLPFYLPMDLENEKKHWKILSFYKCVP